MRVLVTYGTKRGGTAGIAEMLARALQDEGLQADVRMPDEVQSVTDYDAVVVGGSLYGMRWHKAARRFVKQHTEELRDRPVWLFSSGPLDDSALGSNLPPVRQVQKLMDRVEARGHMTFGGRLEPDAKGFPASAMAKHHAGDWRDERHIRGWAAQLAEELRTLEETHRGRLPSQRAHPMEETHGSPTP